MDQFRIMHAFEFELKLILEALTVLFWNQTFRSWNRMNRSADVPVASWRLKKNRSDAFLLRNSFENRTFRSVNRMNRSAIVPISSWRLKISRTHVFLSCKTLTIGWSEVYLAVVPPQWPTALSVHLMRFSSRYSASFSRSDVPLYVLRSFRFWLNFRELLPNGRFCCGRL